MISCSIHVMASVHFVESLVANVPEVDAWL